MKKIMTVVFKVESEGFQAITELKRSPVTGDYTVTQAALLKKENGNIRVLDGFDTGVDTTDDMAIGGMIGSFIGILGGPLGVLLGGSLGALTGSLVDTGDAVDNMSLIERVSEQVVEGEVVLIALEEGLTHDKFSKFDCSIVEEDAAAVAMEIDKAIEAQKEMERQAREKLRQKEDEEFQKKIEDYRAKLAADFDAFKKKFTQE